MKTQTIRAILVALSLLLGLGSGQAQALSEHQPESPQAALGPAFTYQGYLTDSGGSPIDNTCDLRFSLWDALSLGSQIGGNSEVLNVGVDGGYFTATVNSLSEFGAGAFTGQARWLQIAVRCPAGGGTYTDLAPRQALTAAPYASYAPSAGSVPWSGLAGVPGGFADGVDNNDTYTNGAGLNLSGGQFSVLFSGSGSASSAARSDHNHWGANWSGSGVGLTLSGGTVGLSGSGSEAGVRGQTASSSGYGLHGENTNPDTGTGVVGTSSGNDGTGVFGYGYYGIWGSGMVGVKGAGIYQGVYGETTETGLLSYAIDGLSASTSGMGVRGRTTAGSGTTYGVYGESASTQGYGVYGLATASSGTNYGVYGKTNSNLGFGIYGLNTASPDPSGMPTAVYGKSDHGIGVHGQSYDATGVVAIGYWGLYADGSYIGVEAHGQNYGVFGATDTAFGLGGYFNNSANGVALEASSETSEDIFRVSNGSNTVFRVNGLGNVQADGGYHCGNNINDAAGDLNEDEIAPCLFDESPADFAEMLPASQELEPGEVLVVGQDGELARSSQAYQAAVVGVYSTRPSYLGNSQKLGQEGYVPLAIAGLVPVKVSAENGPIQPGDLLVSASIPGHAMCCEGVENCFGRTIGKAMQPLPSGTGVILVLIILQ